MNMLVIHVYQLLRVSNKYNAYNLSFNIYLHIKKILYYHFFFYAEASH